MELTVVAQPRPEFDRWLRRQEQPAAGAGGLQVFMQSGCANCHQIRGTSARGQVGPDLTHLASRVTIGARRLPNDPTHLRLWVRDPQRWKPGAKMPAFPAISQSDFRALISYLESLK
jgi:cytochrome c oxidase subunit 2